MTSRDRLLRVLKGEMPDRVPISTYELVGWDTNNFCNREPSYAPLMDYIREKTDCLCMWDLRSNANFVASAYAPDIVATRVDLPDGHEDHFALRIGKRTLTCRNRLIDNIHTVWRTEHWCKDTGDVDALMSLPYEPAAYSDADAPRIDAELGDRGLLMSSLGDPVLVAMELMEFGEAMLWAMTETEHFARTVERLHERVMQNLERALDVRTVDLYRICGPEYLTPPYLPPKYFERFVLPYVREMTELIHAKGGMVRLHSHGRIGQVLDFIEQTGADALDPCEGPPDGDIELADIKRCVGGRMTLFGNMQLKLLEHGSEAQVREEVGRIMDAAKRDGRFVIMPTAGPINVPLSPKTEANYRAFIDAALEFGAY